MQASQLGVITDGHLRLLKMAMAASARRRAVPAPGAAAGSSGPEGEQARADDEELGLPPRYYDRHHLSAHFVRRGPAAAWDGVRHQRGQTGSPRRSDVIAVIECTAEHRLPGGNHEIMIGRVGHARVSGDGAAPLLFWRGGYASRAPGTARRPEWTGQGIRTIFPRMCPEASLA